jgi:predicted alpha/beta-fold hydrolase
MAILDSAPSHAFPNSEAIYTDASSARWINDFAIPTL